MEKLTITKATEDKKIQTKYGEKLKQGVQFKEHGEIWHDLWGGGFKVGQEIEGTRESREYEGKTYWTFKLPKKDEIKDNKIELLITKVDHLKFMIQQMSDFLIKEPIIDPSDGRDLSEPQF